MKMKNKKGYILLEMMVFFLIAFMIGTWITTMAITEYRSAKNQLEEEKAYYAAISAVRLMAEDMINGNGTFDPADAEREKTPGVLRFRSGEKEVSIPMSLWTERKGESWILHSEVETGISVRTVSIVLEYDQGWYPVRYDSGEKRRDE